MSDLWIKVPLILMAIILVGYFMIRDLRKPIPEPSWPPKCNSDIEVKINELIKEIDELKKLLKETNEKKKRFTRVKV